MLHRWLSVRQHTCLTARDQVHTAASSRFHTLVRIVTRFTKLVRERRIPDCQNNMVTHRNVNRETYTTLDARRATERQSGLLKVGLSVARDVTVGSRLTHALSSATLSVVPPQGVFSSNFRYGRDRLNPVSSRHRQNYLKQRYICCVRITKEIR